MTVIFEYQTFVKDHTLSIALHLPYWFGMSKVQQRKMYKQIWKMTTDVTNRFHDECVDNVAFLRQELGIMISETACAKEKKRLEEIETMLHKIMV